MKNKTVLIQFIMFPILTLIMNHTIVIDGMPENFFVNLFATIGTWSHTQMMATSVTIPVMIFFSFMPMLSLFNTTIAKIVKFTYSEQISLMLGQVNNFQLKAENICIIIMNILIATVLFAAMYKKCGLA